MAIYPICSALIVTKMMILKRQSQTTTSAWLKTMENYVWDMIIPTSIMFVWNSLWILSYNFLQVQCQLFCAKRSYSDCVVWTEKEVHIERMYPDEGFWLENVSKLRHYITSILPELLGKFYSRTSESVLPQKPSPSLSLDISAKAYCYCRGGDIVGCDNPSCLYEWFYLTCQSWLLNLNLSIGTAQMVGSYQKYSEILYESCTYITHLLIKRYYWITRAQATYTVLSNVVLVQSAEGTNSIGCMALRSEYFFLMLPRVKNQISTDKTAHRWSGSPKTSMIAQKYQWSDTEYYSLKKHWQ